MTFLIPFQTSGFLRISLWCGGVALLTAAVGCEHKEKVLDIKGPGIDIEVNKTTSGKHEVEIQKSDKSKIQIETKN